MAETNRKELSQGENDTSGTNDRGRGPAGTES